MSKLPILDNETEKIGHPWEEKRAHGKGNYILLYGVIGWGVTVAVLISIINLLTGEPTLLDFVLNFVFFPLGGLFWGWFTWKYMENNYQKLRQVELNRRVNATQNRIEELWGMFVKVPFVNKAGRTIQGMDNWFFEMEERKLFIKFDEGNVLANDLEEYENKRVEIQGYISTGLWDTSDTNIQSRMGDYLVVLEVLTKD